MTFSEFLEKARKDHDSFSIKDIEYSVLACLREEGFSEKQIYSLKLGELWKLWNAANLNILTRDLLKVKKELEENPDLAKDPQLENYLKKMGQTIEYLEQKEKTEFNEES
jgi:hypothetical protein